MRSKYAEEILARITPEERQRYNDNFVKFYRVRYARVSRKAAISYTILSRDYYLIPLHEPYASLSIQVYQLRQIIKPK